MSGKILIIDDDNRNIFALKAVLKSRGYQCVSSIGGAEGIELIEKDKEVGIILLDMMMPEMDGYETLSVIRNGKRKDIPVIAVTAQAMIGDKEKCLEAGANAYISKPIDVDLLISVINRYLK